MKKCPNCGKENEDEAVICHYCWRELPQSINRSLPGKTIRSVWVTGAIWAAVITALAGIGAVIGFFRSLHAVLGSLAIGTILSFIFLWLVCTLITWRWRNAGKRRILEIGVIISFIVFWITLSVVAEILLNPAQPLSSITPITPTATSAGSPTPNPLGNCYAWDAITSAQVGQNFCIYGKVSEFGGTVILFSRNNSQVRITYKPIGVYLRLQQGECIVAKGLITSENGVLMLTTSEISDCPPGFNP